MGRAMGLWQQTSQLVGDCDGGVRESSGKLSLSGSHGVRAKGAGYLHRKDVPKHERRRVGAG